MKKFFFRVNVFFVLCIIIIFVIWKLIIWISYYITSPLPLSQIIVTGHRIYTTNHDIRRSVLKNTVTGTLINQEDIRYIQKKIKCFSWIQQVSVRKQWPDKIKIHIIEYVPVAYWNHIYMITKDAVMFRGPEGYVKNESLPMLFGPSGSERVVLMSYYVFNNILKSSSFKIKSVSMDHRYSWKIVLNDGVKLILGRKGNVLRLQRFIKVYPLFLEKYMSTKDESIHYVDLRYRLGFSVKKEQVVQYGN